MKTKYIKLLLICGVGSLLITSCNKYVDDPIENRDPELLIANNYYELAVGDVWKLEYRLLNVSGVTPTFASTNENVAKVDNKGNISGVDVGTANIVVSYGSLSEVCTVAISAAREYSISIGNDSIILFEGSNYLLSPTLVKNNYPVMGPVTFTYSIEDELIASVSEGKLIGNSNGKTRLIINATYENKDIYKVVAVQVNPDYYIDCPNYFTFTYEEGNVIDFPIIEIRDVETDELITGKEIRLEANTNLIEIDNDNKKIKLIESGDFDLEVCCGSISKTTSAFVRHGGSQKEEYGYFWCNDSISNYEVYGINSKATKVYPEINPYLLKNSNVGNKHNGETLFVQRATSTNPDKLFKYPGFFFPPRQSKEELTALKDEGYKYVTFDFYKEAVTTTHTWWGAYVAETIGYHSGVTEQHGFAWRSVDDLNKWLTMEIPLEEVIKYYDNLVNHTKPLFYFCTDDTANDFTFYISELKIIK